jgi:hypothetical protein
MHLRNISLVAAAVIAVARPGACQQANWSTPLLGHFYDTSSNTITKIAGIPGAASVDGAIPSAVKLRAAHIAPGRDFAVAQTVDEGVVLLDWSSGEVAVRELRGAPDGFASVAFSPSGNIAAIASASQGKVQLWRGLPGSPVIDRENAFDADVLAVSDDGTIAAIRTDGVYLIDADGAKLLASGTFSAIAFRPGTGELAAAEKVSDTIVSLRSRDEGATTIANSEQGVAEPVGLQFSVDGRKLVIANRRGRSATAIDLTTRAAATVNCDCSPSLVSTGTGNAVFRVTGPGPSNEPLVFLDANSAEPRVFLVPVAGVNR